jgi:hypothetical protein
MASFMLASLAMALLLYAFLVDKMNYAQLLAITYIAQPEL